MSKTRLVTGMTVVLVLAQASAAGVSWWLREDADGALSRATANNVDLRRRAEEVPAAPSVEVATPPPRWVLPESNDVPATMQLLESMCDGEGVTVDGIKAATTNSPGRQSFVLAVRGAPQALCALLVAFERHERLLVVETGRVRPGPEGTVTAELGVAAIHQGGGR